MRETIDIGGKTYELATNAYTPIAYKSEFGKDYFQDLFQMLQSHNVLQLGKKKEVDAQLLANFDVTFFHRLFWIFAKSANPTIPPFETFFMEMEVFPLGEVAPVLMRLLNRGLNTQKKSMTGKKRVKRSSR